MKYTKKYNKRRKPKTIKKRPKRKSRKHAKKRGGGLFSKKDVETKQQQLNAFNEEFPYDDNTKGTKNVRNLIYKVDNIIGLPEQNIFIRFNDLYQELKGPALSCKSDTKYTDLNTCENVKLEYYNDLSNSLKNIKEKLNNTVSEDRPTFDYNLKLQDNAGLAKVDEDGTTEYYELTPKDFVKIRKMEKQIKELEVDTSRKIQKHKSKLGIIEKTVDEMEREEEEKRKKDRQRMDKYYEEAREMKQKLEEQKLQQQPIDV